MPSVDLYEGTPTNKVNIKNLTTGKKVIIFAVPGAFTPGCSKACINYITYKIFKYFIGNIYLVIIIIRYAQFLTCILDPSAWLRRKMPRFKETGCR